MWIFIRDIPSTTDCKALCRLVAAHLKPVWLPTTLLHRKCIKRCEILRITNRESLQVEHHAVVKLDSILNGQRTLASLVDVPLADNQVTARRYFHRSGQRDRRQYLCEIWKERRRKDRRRSNLLIERLL